VIIGLIFNPFISLPLGFLAIDAPKNYLKISTCNSAFHLGKLTFLQKYISFHFLITIL